FTICANVTSLIRERCNKFARPHFTNCTTDSIEDNTDMNFNPKDIVYTVLSTELEIK
ncbi:19203_t:CDS:1, partial [Dentiscutata erythropus]